jgi:hypothetical protein
MERIGTQVAGFNREVGLPGDAPHGVGIGFHVDQGLGGQHHFFACIAQ